MTWTALADLPGGSSTSVAEAGQATIGDRVYATGGILRNVFLGPTTNMANYYDESSFSWVAIANMPAVRATHGCAAVGTKIYAVGGQNNAGTKQNTNYEYDPSTGTWSSKATLPSARLGNTCVAVGTSMYSIGGLDSGGSAIDDVDAWDQGTNTWSSCAPLPVALALVGAAAVGTDIFVFGGFTGSVSVDTVYKYDTLTDTWSTLGTAPEAASFFNRAAALDGIIYLLGAGYDSDASGTFDKTILRSYDPTTDTWGTEDDMPVYRQEGVTASAAGFYVVAGYNFSATFNSLYRWTLSSSVMLHLPEASVQHVCADASRVVAIANVTDEDAGVIVGVDIAVLNVTGSITDTWTVVHESPGGDGNVAYLSGATGSCLDATHIYFGLQHTSYPSDRIVKVALADGSLTEIINVSDIDVASLDPGNLFNGYLYGIVEVDGDLIINGDSGFGRIQQDGTPVWWVNHAAPDGGNAGLAHSGNGSVWVCDSDAEAHEYLYDGTFVQTITLVELAAQAWLLRPRGGWSVDFVLF